MGHLKGTLQIWMDQLLRGPWDEAYYELRCRIGRMHVRIALPQHYMFGAMNVLRAGVQRGHRRALPRPARRSWTAVRGALSKILDLELAIMLHTYREDLLAQQARTERLSTFGQLVGSIGHELRNPLGVIETSLFILKGRRPPGTSARSSTWTASASRWPSPTGIVSDLLDMIRDRPLKREPVRLAEVWQSAAGAVQQPPQVVVSEQGLAELPAGAGRSRTSCGRSSSTCWRTPSRRWGSRAGWS